MRRTRTSHAKKSPIRMVCTVPAWASKTGKAHKGQSWAHIFDDPSEPWKNWTSCRWTCSRNVKVAQFRQISDPSRYAILHPSTKPRLEKDPRVKRSGGWQLSFFDDMGASGDVWGTSCDDVLRRAFEKKKSGFAAYDARDWKLENVVGHDSFKLRGI